MFALYLYLFCKTFSLKYTAIYVHIHICMYVCMTINILVIKKMKKLITKQEKEPENNLSCLDHENLSASKQNYL